MSKTYFTDEEGKMLDKEIVESIKSNNPTIRELLKEFMPYIVLIKNLETGNKIEGLAEELLNSLSDDKLDSIVIRIHISQLCGVMIIETGVEDYIKNRE